MITIILTSSLSPVLDLRASPGSMTCGAPHDQVTASPDCSIICDDKDFFNLVGFWLRQELK